MKKKYYYDQRKEILNNFFKKLFEKKSQTVFTESLIKELQNNHGVSLKMASYFFDTFLDFLISNNFLTTLTFNINSPYREKTIWVSTYFQNKSDYAKFIEIFQVIYPRGYFSHYTAMRYYKLTEQLPKSIYINQEQQYVSKEHVQYEKNNISQKSLDSALQKVAKKRESTLSLFNYTGFKISGKNTKNIGTTSANINNFKIKITSIERTLIDIMVHQEYSGGIGEVIDAYVKTYHLHQEGEINFSINKTIRILKKLNYIYPYYQSIGFLLEKVGFNVEKIKKEFTIEHNFYLTRGLPLNSLALNKSWKIYIPNDLDQLL